MIYTYEGCCGVPGWERVCSLADYECDPSFQCPGCGKQLKQTIPRIKVFTKSFEAFRSPVDGSIISNHRELTEHNKRNGVVNLHDGYDEKAVKSLTERNWQKPPEDIKPDMAKAIQKLEDGYKPAPAPYTEEIPDA